MRSKPMRLEVLLQEHCIPRPNLASMQCSPMPQGWHGVWDAAKVIGPRCGGGTVVLARRPSLIFRETVIARATAVTCWTRGRRVHVI